MEGNCLSHHRIKGKALTKANFDLNHLTEVMFPSFLAAKLPLSTPVSILNSGKNHDIQPTLKRNYALPP
jgi:hypothetical protein